MISAWKGRKSTVILGYLLIKIFFFPTLVVPVTHVCSFTDEVAALHHGFEGHVEVFLPAAVICDAAERIHVQLLLNHQQRVLVTDLTHTTRHTHKFLTQFWGRLPLSPAPWSPRLVCWSPPRWCWGSSPRTFAVEEQITASRWKEVPSRVGHHFNQISHLCFEEAAAKRRPCWNDFQKADFGLLHCDAALFVVGGEDVLQAEDETKKNVTPQSRWSSPSPPGSSFHLLPVVRSHDVYLVRWDELLQYLGDCDTLGCVRINLDSEEQPAQVDHVLSGAVVTPLKVLGQLLHGATTEAMHCGDSVSFRRDCLALEETVWLNTWGKWNVRSATGSLQGITLNQSFLLNITR